MKPYKAHGVAVGMSNVFELAISKVFAGEAYMHSYGSQLLWVDQTINPVELTWHRISF